MKFNKKHKKRIAISKLSEKNPMWKGNKAGLKALHIWVKYRLKKPKLCVNCKKNKSYDLANISQKYKRNLNDWEWLCRRCHMEKDGRLKNFKNNREQRHKKMRENPILVKCAVCSKINKHKAKGLCLKCWEHVIYYWKKRNKQTNLKLLSFKESINKVKGGNNMMYGEMHYNSKLTKKEVLKIRKLYKDDNILQRELAKMFNVSRYNINAIVNYRTWKHIN
jgi:hypothetical protein